MVPIVRCHKHGQQRDLNLDLGGDIYISGLYWVNQQTNVDAELLETPARLFAIPPKAIAWGSLTPRPAQVSATMLDLTAVYNAFLADGWQGFPGNDLSRMPPGVQSIDGVSFDVRGVIQLGGVEAGVDFPAEVDGVLRGPAV